jgi:Ca-activated chloride channel family protein
MRLFPALLLALAAAGAQEPPSFKVEVKLVRIVATVKNGSGQLVGDLNKDDFEVRDNGVPQALSVFEHHTEQPLSIAVMIDISASTAIDLKYEVESVNRFFRALFREGNPDDRAAVFTFNWQTEIATDYTHHLVSLEKGLKGLKAEGGTSLYDAISLVAGSLEDREGRHVMIVVTDGGDTTSTKNFHDALQSAQMADAVLYPILVVPVSNDPGRNVGGENALTTLAAGTGGRVFTPAIGPGLDAAFSEIIRDLRTQYLLGYYPKNVPLTKDRYHRLEVKVKRPELQVSARSGYYGETESAEGWRPAR